MSTHVNKVHHVTTITRPHDVISAQAADGKNAKSGANVEIPEVSHA